MKQSGVARTYSIPMPGIILYMFWQPHESDSWVEVYWGFPRMRFNPADIFAHWIWFLTSFLWKNLCIPSDAFPMEDTLPVALFTTSSQNVFVVLFMHLFCWRSTAVTWKLFQSFQRLPGRIGIEDKKRPPVQADGCLHSAAKGCSYLLDPEVTCFSLRLKSILFVYVPFH